MFDTMLIVTQAESWKDREFVHLPCENDQPVIWLTDDHVICMYHPALFGLPKQSIRAQLQWDEPTFQRVCGQLVGAAQQLIRKRMQEDGSPGGYYSGFADLVRKIRQGDDSFTSPYEGDGET